MQSLRLMEIQWMNERERTALLKAEIDLLNARIAAQKDDIERLLAHNMQLANPPKYARSMTPIHVSEEAEDIAFAKDTGLLSLAEAEDMLRELEFENPTIIEDEGAFSF